jgi:hypothetical protein
LQSQSDQRQDAWTERWERLVKKIKEYVFAYTPTGE